MSDNAQKTEKPTKRRLDKARSEGQFPVSRELAGAVQFLAFVWILFSSGEHFITGVADLSRRFFIDAFRLQLDLRTITTLYRAILETALTPLLVFGAFLALFVLAVQLASTKLGISPGKLAPKLDKLNPLTKIRQLPQQNAGSFIQAILLLPLVGFTVYAIAVRSASTLVQLPLYALRPAIQTVIQSLHDLLWRFALVLAALGALDFFRQAKRHAKGLRMSKQEIREEMKETDGNPQIKMRVRRIQRDLARRNMMKEVPKATAIIVNPTHYSVAIRYDMDSMGAPKVVAKGKNYLALRIRQIAMQHEIPIVENQPLAQALYKSVDVGQEIPANLYRAVAEILAYIYKIMNMRRP